MVKEREWTTIGLTREQYEKATKLRAYMEYSAGYRMSFGEIFSFSLGLISGLVAQAKALTDKLDMGEISEEEAAKRIGLIWIQKMRELLEMRQKKLSVDLLLDLALDAIKDFNKIIEG
ncbi:MAG: hypothetical protein AOA65_2353 [Candidatus Bathyarchaeota archaeon BA1]|nr:MAG: hypothetical protein AOA65_2353 [Candidatus Bathyarchaeota archaeon BA1]